MVRLAICAGVIACTCNVVNAAIWAVVMDQGGGVTSLTSARELPVDIPKRLSNHRPRLKSPSDNDPKILSPYGDPNRRVRNHSIVLGPSHGTSAPGLAMKGACAILCITFPREPMICHLDFKSGLSSCCEQAPGIRILNACQLQGRCWHTQ